MKTTKELKQEIYKLVEEVDYLLNDPENGFNISVDKIYDIEKSLAELHRSYRLSDDEYDEIKLNHSNILGRYKLNSKVIKYYSPHELVDMIKDSSKYEVSSYTKFLRYNFCLTHHKISLESFSNLSCRVMGGFSMADLIALEFRPVTDDILNYIISALKDNIAEMRSLFPCMVDFISDMKHVLLKQEDIKIKRGIIMTDKEYKKEIEMQEAIKGVIDQREVLEAVSIRLNEIATLLIKIKDE